MKANKFAMQDDEAVSPVIAVILMVAITVVLAATVYVWVSGFGTSGSIKKFPQVTLRDNSVTLDALVDDETIVILEHRGGDSLNWADYTVNLFAGTATTTTSAKYATAESAAGVCTTGIATTLAGTYAVGNKVYICENGTADWTSTTVAKVQIIDKNQNSIVYENTVVAT